MISFLIILDSCDYYKNSPLDILFKAVRTNLFDMYDVIILESNELLSSKRETSLQCFAIVEESIL